MDTKLNPLKTIQPDRLRWEIALALLLKLLLLIGLWFLIFRWSERPAEKADIASRFGLTPAAHIFSSQLNH